MSKDDMKTPALRDGERLDEVNDNIKLIQKKDGLTFGTDALLLSAYINSRAERALEIGGGTGIISLLALTREKFGEVFSCEVQEDFAELITRNAELNGLSERLHTLFSDIRELSLPHEFDAVFTNPPYMKVESGKANLVSKKNIARHEVHGDIAEFCTAARKLLKFGGKFYAVYRPDRLPDLIYAMKTAGIEPKRLTLVHADITSLPSMLLVEGRRGGGVGAHITRPLIIYTDKEHREESADMKYILNEGSFPSDFSGKRGKRNVGN